MYTKHCRLLLVVVSLCIVSVSGYLTGTYIAGPHEIPFGGEQVRLRDRFRIHLWYHEDGSLSEVAVRDVNSDALLVNTVFYPSGVMKSNLRRTPEGSEFTVYDEAGNVRMTSYFEDGVKMWHREWYENGEVVRREFFDPEAEWPPKDSNWILPSPRKEMK